MLSSPKTQPNGCYRVMLSVLTALVLIASLPAAVAGVVIEGVEEGQVVRGDLKISAISDDNRLTDVTLFLTGPDGTEIINRSSLERVHLINKPGDLTKGLKWDSTKVLPGSYTVSAISTSRGRSGREITTASRTFIVENDNQPEVSATPESPADQPSPQTPTTPPTTETAQPETPTLQNPPVLQLDSQSPTKQVAPSVQTTIEFAEGTPAQRNVGDTDAIRVDVQSPANGSDVLVMAWDIDRKAVVDGFDATFSPDAVLVPASLLDTLPLGHIELQAHYREGGRIVTTAKQDLVIAEAATDTEAPAPSGVEGMPTVSFPADVAKTYTIGSTQGLSFDVSGAMPEAGDVLAIAWSLDEGKLVPGFVQVLDEAPWTISADMMNLLPQGRVEVQLRPRYDGQIIGKIVNTMVISRPTTAELPDGPDSGDGDTVTDNDNDPTDPDAETPVVDATPDGGDTAVPGETANVDIAFAASFPARYVPGSGTPVVIDLDGTLPTGADVLMLMWHKDRGEMVAGFAHELSGGQLQVSNAKLDAVPTGNVEIQALLRVPGQAIVVRKKSMTIVDPNAPDDAVVDNGDPGDVSPNYDGLNLTSDGFTAFKKSADTQVIYVAANGNDSNDGLSTAKPMRTASAAYKKLRDGKPDWLLFKAGDTFSGNLGTISKSGRSANEPMLIGTYGNGDRPKFLSPDGTWAEKFFQTNGNYVSFVGLHIIAVNRDPNRAGFNVNKLSSDQWNASAITILGDAKGVLIEDCIMEYFKFAIVVQSTPNDGYAKDIKIRRNAVLNSYGHWDKKVAGHSSGIYGAYIDGLLIEQNVWYHNGWNPKVNGASRTKFNHNLYIQDNCTGNSVVRGNIIANGSAHGLQLRSGGDIIDNLFVGNPLAFFTGRYESDVLRNVVLKSQDMGTGGDVRGHGIEILPCLYARVENNIVSQKQGSADYAYAIGFNYESKYNDFLGGKPFKASLKDNKVYKWPRDNGASSAIKFGTKPQMTENTRNDLDIASGGSTNPPWIDPERDVESYMKSIGKTASLDALIQAAAFRPRGQWAPEYSAEKINLYIRRGFDVKPFD